MIADRFALTLTRNPDILGNLAGMDLPGLVRIGFAAETQDLLDNARDKLKKKKLDMIVANDAVSSIGAESSACISSLTSSTFAFFLYFRASFSSILQPSSIAFSLSCCVSQ